MCCAVVHCGMCVFWSFIGVQFTMNRTSAHMICFTACGVMWKLNSRWKAKNKGDMHIRQLCYCMCISVHLVLRFTMFCHTTKHYLAGAKIRFSLFQFNISNIYALQLVEIIPSSLSYLHSPCTIALGSLCCFFLTLSKLCCIGTEKGWCQIILKCLHCIWHLFW